MPRFTQKLSILFPLLSFSNFIPVDSSGIIFFFFSFEIQFNPFGHELFNPGQKKVMITSLSSSSNYKLRFFGCVKYLQGGVQEETLCSSGCSICYSWKFKVILSRQNTYIIKVQLLAKYKVVELLVVEKFDSSFAYHEAKGLKISKQRFIRTPAITKWFLSISKWFSRR